MLRILGSFWFVALALSLAVEVGHAQSNGNGTPQRTIWDGVYTAAQAVRGEQAAKQNCTSCHAEAEWDEAFIVSWAGRSVADLHTTIRTTMPFDSPGRLSAAQYADIVAYILKINNIPAGETELPSDDAALQQIAVTRPGSR